MTKKVMAIEYSLKDKQTNEQLDTNVGKEPLEFITNTGQIIIGLEEAICDLEKGTQTQVIVEPKDAYGELEKEAIQTLPREQFADVELKEGMALYGTGEDGQTVQVVVSSFNDEEVTIDYNHPLAGKTLVFDVNILDVRDATEDEMQTGVVGGVAGEGCGCGSNDGGCGTKDTHEHKNDDSCCNS
jgi:FKBP-type peptidyl-prolyl cis-trans isomerase SlyD